MRVTFAELCVQFEQNGEITGMESVESEHVAFVEAINPAATGAVEKWLLQTESVMKRTLHSLAGEALRSYAQSERSQWILEWPGQLVLNCSQVYWTQVWLSHCSFDAFHSADDSSCQQSAIEFLCICQWCLSSVRRVLRGSAPFFVCQVL